MNTPIQTSISIGVNINMGTIQVRDLCFYRQDSVIDPLVAKTFCHRMGIDVQVFRSRQECNTILGTALQLYAKRLSEGVMRSLNPFQMDEYLKLFIADTGEVTTTQEALAEALYGQTYRQGNFRNFEVRAMYLPQYFGYMQPIGRPDPHFPTIDDLQPINQYLNSVFTF